MPHPKHIRGSLNLLVVLDGMVVAKLSPDMRSTISVVTRGTESMGLIKLKFQGLIFCAGEHTLHGHCARSASYMELVRNFLVNEELSRYCYG
jgi:hypothetical protein